MNLESDKIKIKASQSENIPHFIHFEEQNPEFIGAYDYDTHQQVMDSEDEIHLSIFDKSDNQLIGHAILAGIKGGNDSIEFRRIVIARKGKGYGHDTVELVKQFCFEQLHTHRLWLDVYEDNPRAIHLYQSHGFMHEGTLRDCVKQNGKYRSLMVMSILKTDVPLSYSGINYHNKKFVPVQNSDNGEVSTDTIFHYQQKENILTCQYKGEQIQQGHLMGLVDENGAIEMRYHQINSKDELMTGVCKSTPELLKNGKIRLHEKWQWTSGYFSEGESVLEEV